MIADDNFSSHRDKNHSTTKLTINILLAQRVNLPFCKKNPAPPASLPETTFRIPSIPALA